MDVQRAQQIYESKDTIPVHLDDGNSVWIENVDIANKMATVQVGTSPTDTMTVSVDRLQEQKFQ
ncbi:H-type small acid-soluble spore protein [Paenibacillus selenitireducens]|jgi:small acid-soluble spore protein H (minor)|uniref:H-type small acid-soluble spore protein n=1 Tax=Paenibacillus selenitireducens TaxID=1324314 RepID=A0A1T2X2Q0_9BACL|nr:H-type small acid-soluble spore protein [Paenibacillus selenitireducens]OPA74095.1 H-type small acid-soluble spore protein [Paenibacillus selenitireducens]